MTEKTINSHILKLTGRAELPRELNEGHNHHVSLEGGIEKVELHDNHDGTWNKIYVFKPIKLEVLNELGEVLKLKDTRSNSQLFRARLWKQWQNADFNGDFDMYYDIIMSRLIMEAEEVAEMYGPGEEWSKPLTPIRQRLAPPERAKAKEEARV